MNPMSEPMSSIQRENILLCYEQIPEEIAFFFIPADSDLPLPLLHALIRLEDVYVNHVTKSPDTPRADKDVAYLQAATCSDREHLDASDEFQQNRFFNMLNKYRVGDEPFSFDANGAVHLIRTGIML
jgi:hypothetical protein